MAEFSSDPSPVPALAVSYSGTAALAPTARALATSLNVDFVAPCTPSSAAILLVVTATQLQLCDARNPRTGPIAIDFTQRDVRRHSPSLSRRQPLARAIGAKHRTVVDATAGFGQDAFLLACMGYRVTAIERCAPLHALLQDGIRRACNDPLLAAAIGGRLHLIYGEAAALLPSLAAAEVIYMDPMFPAKRKKSAAVSKEMRLLRVLSGDDLDASQLFASARVHASARVVVKRPHHAPPLMEAPDLSYGGKLVRYDVYLTLPIKK